MTAHLQVVPDPVEVVDPADVLMAIDDEIESLKVRRQIPLSVLWDSIGKPMLAAKKKRLEKDGFVYHVGEPKEREYCNCHMTLLYTCPDGPEGYRVAGTTVKADARPSFWIRHAKEKPDAE